MYRKSSFVVCIGIISSLFFLLVFLHELVASINLPLAGDDDVSLGYFILENNFTKLSSLDFGNLFETQMFYPLKNTLSFGNSLLGQAILGLPLYIITKNVFISTHFVFLLNFFLSFLFMYLLCYRLVKNIIVSIISSLIYTYHPFVWSQFPDHIEMVTIEWLPLIFLLTESLLIRVRLPTVFLLTVILFMQLLSSFYLIFLIAVILPVYLAIRIFLDKMSLRHFLKVPLVLFTLALILFGYLYLKPYIESKSTYKVQRSVAYTTLFSAHLSDFIFAPPENKLYGWMVGDENLSRLRHPWVVLHSTEHNLFFGIVPSLLTLFTIPVCIFKLRKSNKQVIPYLIVFGLSLILMFGPYIRIGDLKLPSLYLLLYNVVPFADGLRVPTRFAFMMYLSLGVLVAFVLAYVSARSKKIWSIVCIIIIALIVFEYRTQPPKPYIVQDHIVRFYSWLDSQKDVKVIIELPMGNGIVGDKRVERSMSADSKYLFLALFHDKNMVNGYSGFVPPEVFEIGNMMADEFPSPKTMTYLKNLGVDMVIVHKDEYYDQSLAKDIIKRMDELGMLKQYESGPIYGFSLN